MTESKIELTERLRREGRWAEASKLKDEAIKEAKKAGMKSDEAKDAGWDAMEKAYPPLPSTAEPEHGDEDAKGRAVVLVGSSALPDTWGELPDSAPFEVEIEWVHQNRVLVVEDRASGKSLLHWERARKPAPSYGAVNLMEFAATNRKGFMDILQRVKPGDNGDEENIRREKMKIGEIQRILDEINEGMDAELRADVPKVLQQRVRDMLSNWVKHSGVALADDSRAHLDSAIVTLIRDSMRAAAPSCGGE